MRGKLRLAVQLYVFFCSKLIDLWGVLFFLTKKCRIFHIADRINTGQNLLK